jgi:hypothetical protein
MSTATSLAASRLGEAVLGDRGAVAKEIEFEDEFENR